MALATRGHGALRGELGAIQFFTLSLGAIVGVGWVVVLGDWLRQAGPIGTIVGLTGGGLVVCVIGLCYAEMGTTVPTNGGEVAFAYEVYGAPMSFMVGWLLALTYVAVAAFEAISIGWIASTLVSGIEGRVLYESWGAPVRIGSLSLGLGGMALLTWLNYRGAKSATHLQDALIGALLLISVVFIAAGIARGDTANLRPFFQRDASGSVWNGVLSIFMTAAFWFGGFNVVPQVLGERSPETPLRKIGQMILLSIVVGIAFKTLVVLSASMTMPWHLLTTVDLPVAAAFGVAFGSTVLAKLVLVAALFGLLSTWNSVLVSGSRILFALGRASIIAPLFGTVNPRSGAPAKAVLFTAALATVGTLLGREALLPIVNVSSACLAFAYLLTCLAVLKLRRREPDRERPYRVPGGALTVWVGVLGSAATLALALYQPWAGAKGRLPLEWIILGAWLLIGAGFWLAAGRLRGQMAEQDRRRAIMGDYA